MDMRWDHGLISNEQDFMTQRIELQQELEQLTPVSNTDLQQAASLLENFGTKLDAIGDDVEAQHDLIKLILERVYVEDDRVAAMTLKSNCHLVLGHNGRVRERRVS